MPKILNKRGTRANLNTLASANGLSAGEVYLITDENKIAIGLSSSTYEAFAKESSNSFTSLQSFSGSTTAMAAYLVNAKEKITVTTLPAVSFNYYLSTQSIIYFTSNAANNWILNLTFAATPTTLNSVMSIGEALTCAYFVTNSTTAYYSSVVQVDGTATGVTTKWLGGAPTSGNASAIDAYSYTIIKTANATFTVFASQVRYA